MKKNNSNQTKNAHPLPTQTKPVHKVKRYTFSVNPLQEGRLRELMLEDAETNPTLYLPRLISMVWATRAKRPVLGRPKKTTGNEQDQRPLYLHPDQLMNKGKLLTRDEITEWYRVRSESIPQTLQDQFDANE